MESFLYSIISISFSSVKKLIRKVSLPSFQKGEKRPKRTRSQTFRARVFECGPLGANPNNNDVHQILKMRATNAERGPLHGVTF